MLRRCARPVATLLLALMLLGGVPLGVRADEGMFLPDAISSLPLEKLEKRGLKLKAKDLYDPNGVSLKDAIVIVGGGTGEFVSPDGLLLTNHHVAYDALVAASTPQNNYGESGFTARGRNEELPAKEYTVTITQALQDVTAQVLNGVSDTLSAQDRARAIQTRIRELETTGKNDAEGISVRVVPMNEGLSYYKFTYLILRDVRIAYAPPKSIGFYGGDPDNFEWPRHCGDFSFMRAYVGKDGKPADYSTENVPYKPKRFLTLSTAGVKENDFTMVMGYPGTTRRYRESFSISYNQDIAIPNQLEAWRKQIDQLKELGRNNPELRVKLQSDIFGLENAYKAYEGGLLAIRRANLVEQRRAEEAAFARWVGEKPERQAKYGEALPSLARAYDDLLQGEKRGQIVDSLSEATPFVNLITLAYLNAEDRAKPAAERNPRIAQAVQQTRAELAQTLKERKLDEERAAIVNALRAADTLPNNQRIPYLESRYGTLTGEARARAQDELAAAIVDEKTFGTEAGVNALFDTPAADFRARTDAPTTFALALYEINRLAQERTQNFNSTVARWRPLLIAGMSEFKGTKPYPDANRTLRFSYGDVQGYVPREALRATPFTTLAGVIEKDTGREPFDAPAKLKELYRAKDYGTYGVNGMMPVDFLTTNDIIGGNSGSPIMNGRGEQVGIVFDGNYEGLGNDFFFNPDLGRTIAVDIRYVLFLTDKFGGAGWILSELDIKK